MQKFEKYLFANKLNYVYTKNTNNKKNFYNKYFSAINSLMSEK